MTFQEKGFTNFLHVGVVPRLWLAQRWNLQKSGFESTRIPSKMALSTY